MTYHEAQIAPLVEEVSIHIDTVWLRQIFRDQLPDRWQILGLLLVAIWDILDFGDITFDCFAFALGKRVVGVFFRTHRDGSRLSACLWMQPNVE